MFRDRLVISSALRRVSALRGPARLELQRLLQHIVVRHGDGQHAHLCSRPQDRLALDLPLWIAQDWAGERSVGTPIQLACVLAFWAEEADDAAQDPQAIGDQTVLAMRLGELAHAAWIEATDYPLTDEPLELRAASAMAHRLQRPVAPLREMVSNILEMRRIVEAFASLRQDIVRGRSNELIAEAMQAIGLGMLPPSFELVMAGLLGSDLVPRRCRHAIQAIVRAHAMAEHLGLPTVAAALDEQRLLVHDVWALLANHPEHPGPHQELPFFFLPVMDVQQDAIDQAERFLLADPTYREAWETQRRHLGGASEQYSIFFQTALILDLWRRLDRPIAAQADAALEMVVANRFRYLQDSSAFPPDLDSLALAWRLLPVASDPAGWRQRLEETRAWVTVSQCPDGSLPVWLNDPLAPPDPNVTLFGHFCVGVEANLFLSAPIMELPAPLLTRAARRWSERLSTEGTGAINHYQPMVGLWLCLRAAQTLGAMGVLPADEHAALINTLRTLVQAEGSEDAPSPQSAALQILCARLLGQPVRPSWLRRVTSSQRYDGAWDAEPLFLTCALRLDWCDWYLSRTLTTTICLEALMSKDHT